MTDQANVLPVRRFNGSLAIADNQVDVSFSALIDRSGDLQIDLDQIPLNAETKFIMTNWFAVDKIRRFSLTGISDDGTQFETDDLYFDQIGPKRDESTNEWLDFVARATSAVFRISVDAVSRPRLTLYVRGFECAGSLIGSCELGRVVMSGPYNNERTDSVSGIIAIEARDEIEDASTWKKKAEGLACHVNVVMSFAAGVKLSVPVTEFRADAQSRVVFKATTDQHRSDMPVFHMLAREEIFATALASYFDPSNQIANLWMVVEWFTMRATHNEMRLLCMMTALENIINSNLTNRMKKLLRDSEFSLLRAALSDSISAIVTKRLGDTAQSELAAAVFEKLAETKRATIKSKLQLLIERWTIPMAGLQLAQIEAAISARNKIVHTGSYYSQGSSQVDLWEHVTAIREIVIRAVLARLGFRGMYVTHFGGYRLGSFPPTES